MNVGFDTGEYSENILLEFCKEVEQLRKSSPSPPKSEPASLLSRLLSLVSRSSLGIARLGLFLRILNVIPGNVEENGLDGHHIQARRKLDNVVEVGTAKGIFVQFLDKRSVAFILLALSLHLPQVIDMDNGTVALQLAINHLF